MAEFNPPASKPAEFDYCYIFNLPFKMADQASLPKAASRFECNECQTHVLNSQNAVLVPCAEHNKCNLCESVISCATAKINFNGVSHYGYGTVIITVTHSIVVEGSDGVKKTTETCCSAYKIHPPGCRPPDSVTGAVNLATVEVPPQAACFDVLASIVFCTYKDSRTIMLTLVYCTDVPRPAFVRFDMEGTSAHFQYLLNGKLRHEVYEPTHIRTAPLISNEHVGGFRNSYPSVPKREFSRVQIATEPKKRHPTLGTPSPKPAFVGTLPKPAFVNTLPKPAFVNTLPIDYRACLKTPRGVNIAMTNRYQEAALTEQYQEEALKKALEHLESRYGSDLDRI